MLLYRAHVDRPSDQRPKGRPGIYLRRIGLNYQPRGMVDLDQVEAMLRVSADAGRLGGLLKMWLTDDARMASFGRDMRPEITAAVAKIGETQAEIQAIAQTVLRART